MRTPTHVVGIMVNCPHCKRQLHIEFNNPMKKEKASKLVKKVEKIYTGEEVQKEFDERKKQKECTCPDCSSKLKIKKYKGKDRYECSQCGFTAFVEGWV